MNTLGPSPKTKHALDTALTTLKMAESLYARRKGDRWSTEKLHQAKNDVRLAHFHNTMGGGFITTERHSKELPHVAAGFDAAEESYW